MDGKRPDRSPEAVPVRSEGLLRDGAQRPRGNWKGAIRQGLGRVRRTGSPAGSVGSINKTDLPAVATQGRGCKRGASKRRVSNLSKKEVAQPLELLAPPRHFE